MASTERTKYDWLSVAKQKDASWPFSLKHADDHEFFEYMHELKSYDIDRAVPLQDLGDAATRMAEAIAERDLSHTGESPEARAARAVQEAIANSLKAVSKTVQDVTENIFPLANYEGTENHCKGNDDAVGRVVRTLVHAEVMQRVLDQVTVWSAASQDTLRAETETETAAIFDSLCSLAKAQADERVWAPTVSRIRALSHRSQASQDWDTQLVAATAAQQAETGCVPAAAVRLNLLPLITTIDPRQAASWCAYSLDLVLAVKPEEWTEGMRQTAATLRASPPARELDDE